MKDDPQGSSSEAIFSKLKLAEKLLEIRKIKNNPEKKTFSPYESLDLPPSTAII